MCFLAYKQEQKEKKEAAADRKKKQQAAAAISASSQVIAEPLTSGASAGGGASVLSQPGAAQLGLASLGTTATHIDSGTTSAGVTENDDPMEVDYVASHGSQVPAPVPVPVTVVASSIPTT